MNKLIATALTFISIALAGYSTTTYFSPKPVLTEPKAALDTVWSNDIEALRQNSKIDKLWNQIKVIDLKAGDELAKAWIPKSIPNLKENPKGRYRLETIVLAWQDDENVGAIILYHLIDIKSENLLWELGRTLILN